MQKNEITVLIISGPVGVGKSSVGQEVSEILEDRKTPHTFIDFDQLRYTYPRPADDPWGNRLALQNLKDIWKNCAKNGALNLVIAQVVENNEFIRQLSTAIPNSKIITYQLDASPETLMSRVQKREIGSGLEWHEHRALELREILNREDTPCDGRVTTDNRAVIDIAEEVVNRVSWRLT